MASGEILACSKFYVEFDGLTEKIIRKVDGIAITMKTAGGNTSLGVTKGGKSVIQATPTGVTLGTIQIEFAATGDKDLEQWYSDSHSEAFAGGGSSSGGERKTGSIILYNQGGDEAARWNLQGVMPNSYEAPALSAGSTDIATEKIEVSFESLHRVK